LLEIGHAPAGREDFAGGVSDSLVGVEPVGLPVDVRRLVLVGLEVGLEALHSASGDESACV